MMSETHSTNTADLVTVPREPTQAMLDAAKDALWKHFDPTGAVSPKDGIRVTVYPAGRETDALLAWRAMLDASPALAAFPAHATGAMRENRSGIYVASKTKHAGRWLEFRANGWPINSTWIDEAGPGESADLNDLWQRCVAEASSARVLVVYREPDDVLKGGWVEVGAALASGVPVFAVGLEGFSIANDKRIRHFPDLDAAMKAARGEAEFAARFREITADPSYREFEALCAPALSSPAQEGEAAPVRTDADGVLIDGELRAMGAEYDEDDDRWQHPAHRQQWLSESPAEYLGWIKGYAIGAEHAASKPEGETGPAMAEDVVYAVWSQTGIHIGLWPTEELAYHVLEEYPGGKVEKLYRRAALTVSPSPSERDQHQGETERDVGRLERERDAALLELDDIRHLLAEHEMQTVEDVFEALENCQRGADANWKRAQVAKADLANVKEENARLQNAMLILGAYLLEKGEAFRVDEGAELADAYSAALSTPEAVPVTDQREGEANG